MSGFGQHLEHSLRAVLGGLPVGSLAGGFVVAFHAVATDSGRLSDLPAAIGLGLVIALSAAVVGIIPSCLYGAPLYALLARWRLAGWLSALLVGTLPGALLLPASPDIARLVFLFGGCVALATHAVARRRLTGVAGDAADSSRSDASTR